MHKNRLEAFSDGVLAIIITIMVLELKMPHGDQFQDLFPLIPVFLSYALSFVYIGIYWNNHHHLFQVVERVDGKILWANLHLLFWLSLVPAATAWSGENHFSSIPVFLYGLVLLLAAISYYTLTVVLLRSHGRDSKISIALGSDFKGKISLLFYVLGMGFTFLSPYIGMVFYVLVAGVWLIPDQRIEKVFSSDRRK